MNYTNSLRKESKFKKIIRNFYPTYVYDSVESIPYFVFDKYNIKLIMIDMDNTLIDHKANFNDDIKKWVKGLKRQGIKLYILSNSFSKNTVKETAHKLGMQYYIGANKPFLKGFKYILEKENVSKSNAIMIGDQVFTDVLGGNRFGIRTILVRPIAKKESIVAKVKRPFEKILLNSYIKHKEDTKCK